MRRECTHRMAVTRRWRSGSSSFARRRRAGRSETDRMVSLCRRAGTTSHSRYRHLRRQMSRFARHLYCLRSSPRRASSLLLSSSTVSRLCWTHSRPLQACATSGAIPAAATAAPPPPSFSFGPPPPSAEPWPMGVSLPPPTIGAAALTDIALRRRRGASAGGGSRRFLLGSVVRLERGFCVLRQKVACWHTCVGMGKTRVVRRNTSNGGRCVGRHVFVLRHEILRGDGRVC